MRAGQVPAQLTEEVRFVLGGNAEEEGGRLDEARTVGILDGGLHLDPSTTSAGDARSDGERCFGDGGTPVAHLHLGGDTEGAVGGIGSAAGGGCGCY